jgi:hypothetical protein
MDLERVSVRLDELTERPLISGLRTSQQQTLIHVVGSDAHTFHYVKRLRTPKLIGGSRCCPRSMNWRRS